MAVDMCVIFNPSSGRGRAAGRLAQLQSQWADRAVFWPTTQPGHAEELAQEAAVAGYRVIAAAGGDGTVHEVANGILNSGRKEVAFAVFPMGSANDFAHSLEYVEGARSEIGGCMVDVGQVRNSAGRQRYFVCCLGVGFSGMVTLESRKIRWLRGVALYGLATLRALWNHYACPPIELTIDEQPAETWPTLMLSVLLGRREGGFVLAPDAKLDDGLLDYVHVGKLSRFEVLRLLPRIALAGPPKSHPRVKLGRCQSIKIKSAVALTAHVDGEFFALPADDLRELEIRILPQALRVRTLQVV